MRFRSSSLADRPLVGFGWFDDVLRQTIPSSESFSEHMPSLRPIWMKLGICCNLPSRMLALSA